MPGKRGSPARSLRIRFSRTSWCTSRRATLPSAMARRRSPTVEIPVGLGIGRFYLMLNARCTTLQYSIRRRRSRIGRAEAAVSGFEHLALSIVPFFSPRPQVFAHRGGCDLGPENTIAAFDIGMSTGADGLELDVHLSADNVLVVHHDRTLDRTTDATGPVAARTADELARVDAGYRFARGGDFPFRGRGIGVPTLREVLARYRGVPTIIEIKVYTPAMGRAVAEEIRRAGAIDSACVAGYGLASATAARAELP